MIINGINNSMDTKTCSQCNITKPITSFSPSGGAKHRRSKCRDCDRILSKQRSKFKHFLPPVEYTCPICKRDESKCKGKGGQKSGTWCLDHDHETGEFRGWLCHDCNRALGNFKDSTTLLESALQYLKDTGK